MFAYACQPIDGEQIPDMAALTPATREKSHTLAACKVVRFATINVRALQAGGSPLTSPHCGCPFLPQLHRGRVGSHRPGINDYFGARYYESLNGRFLTPDWSAKVEPVPYAKLDNPQSLNLYSYVGNNPLTGVDPDGHFGCNEAPQFCGAISGAEAGTNEPGDAKYVAVNSGGDGAQQQTEVAQNGGGEKLNIDKMVQSLDANAKGVDTYGGKCAGACHKAMADGGIGWDKKSSV